MQTNSKTHPYRVLWMPKRGGYHATAKHKSFATEQEARAAAAVSTSARVFVQVCAGGKYVDLQ